MLGIAFGLISLLGFMMSEARKRIEALEFEVHMLKKLLEDRE